MTQNVTTGRKRRNGTKESTVLSEAELEALVQKHGRWQRILPDWDSFYDGRRWAASDLNPYEFYMQVYLPSRTKLGRYLNGQED